jgi:dephospho-CoA kinase
MSVVLITRCAGAGKSAIAEVLARRGLACIDDDEDPFLARFVDSAGAVVAEEPVQPDLPGSPGIAGNGIRLASTT